MPRTSNFGNLSNLSNFEKGGLVVMVMVVVYMVYVAMNKKSGFGSWNDFWCGGFGMGCPPTGDWWYYSNIGDRVNLGTYASRTSGYNNVRAYAHESNQQMGNYPKEEDGIYITYLGNNYLKPDETSVKFYNTKNIYLNGDDMNYLLSNNPHENF